MHRVENPIQLQTNPMAVPMAVPCHSAAPGSPFPCVQRQESKQDKLPLKQLNTELK